MATVYMALDEALKERTEKIALSLANESKGKWRPKNAEVHSLLHSALFRGTKDAELANLAWEEKQERDGSIHAKTEVPKNV